MCKQNVLQLLGDQVQYLCRIVTEALKIEKSDYRKHADVLTSRSSSSIRNDHMVRLAREQLVGKGFTHIKRGQRNLFDYKSELLIHFKKLNKSFMPTNYPTQQVLDLWRSGTGDSLPGIAPNLPIVSIGYIMDAFSVGISGVFMAHVKGGFLQWVHRLDQDSDSSSNSVPTILPLTPYDPSSTATRTKIRRKNGVSKRDRDAGESAHAG